MTDLQERNERMAARYRSGRSLHQIAAEFGIHHGTVWRHLRRQGVEMRPPAPPKGVYPPQLKEANERDLAYRRWEKEYGLA